MQLESGIVVALLVGAVLIYDRLGGNDELARRLFQVGLAISLVFLVLSATRAFIRQDTGASLSLLSSSSNASQDATDVGDRVAATFTIHYAVGVLLLITGLAMLRKYHTIPLGVILGGVLLILFGGGQGGALYDVLLRLTVESSQEVDVVTFVAAVGGTVGLLWYGTRLEKEFSVDSEPDDAGEPAGGEGD